LLALLAIGGRAPACVIGGVQRAPESGEEFIDEVSLHRIDGVLREGLSTEEIVIVGEEGDGGNQLQYDGAPALDTPSSGLMDQRLVPTFRSLVESY